MSLTRLAEEVVVQRRCLDTTYLAHFIEGPDIHRPECQCKGSLKVPIYPELRALLWVPHGFAGIPLGVQRRSFKDWKEWWRDTLIAFAASKDGVAVYEPDREIVDSVLSAIERKSSGRSDN